MRDATSVSTGRQDVAPGVSREANLHPPARKTGQSFGFFEGGSAPSLGECAGEGDRRCFWALPDDSLRLASTLPRMRFSRWNA